MIDTDAAVRRALDIRSDLRQAKNGLEQNDVSIRYLKNQLMPDVNANLIYRGTGTGGSRYQTDIGAALEGRPPEAGPAAVRRQAPWPAPAAARPRPPPRPRRAPS